VRSPASNPRSARALPAALPAAAAAPDDAAPVAVAGSRWDLYRLLGEPQRLRLLALAGEDELSIGELAELLGESQSNVSRHVAALRKAGLLGERRQGTRVFVFVAESVLADAVVLDALRAGRALAQADGAIARVPQVLRAREQATREHFGRPRESAPISSLPAELPAYLAALAPLLPARGLAVDAGTGDGSLLEVLAPVFERVVGVDREEAQLAVARERTRARGWRNVTLVRGELGSGEVRAAVTAPGAGVAGADAVFASRMLHHAPRPSDVLAALAALARPGGAVVVLDYAPHDDERLRAEQADVWLGFEARDLARMASKAGLEGAVVTPLPAGFTGTGPDRHLRWQVLVARRPATPDRAPPDRVAGDRAPPDLLEGDGAAGGRATPHRAAQARAQAPRARR
jgi:ArsR family transcriptional regulator